MVQNSLDLQTISGYSQITGDLSLTGPGLTTVSLPSLCSVGGNINDYLGAADLVTLDLPGLVSAGGIDVVNAPLHTVNLDALISVGDAIGLGTDGALDFPSLETVTSGMSFGLAPTSINVPKLTTTGFFYVACYPTCPVVTLDALTSVGQLNTFGGYVAAPVLATVGAMYGAAELDVPLLAAITGDFYYGSNVTSQAFPALGSIGGAFTLVNASQSWDFTVLVSIVGDISIQETGANQSVSFPMLTSLDGKTTATYIDVAGPVYAPAVVTAKHGLTIRNASSLDLSALQSVGPGDAAAPCGKDMNANSAWVSIFDLDGSTIAALEFPALASACMLLGQPSSLCTSGNLALSMIDAPNVITGGVQYFNNPALPKCRADAFAAQIPNPVNYGGSAVFEHCPLAAGPCP